MLIEEKEKIGLIEPATVTRDSTGPTLAKKNSMSSNKGAFNIDDLVPSEKLQEEDQLLATSQKNIGERLGAISTLEVKNARIFKPKKIPIFLGIGCLDKDLKESIFTLSRQVLMKIHSQFCKFNHFPQLKNFSREIFG